MALTDVGEITQTLVARIYTDTADRVAKVESGELSVWQALNDGPIQTAEAIVTAIAALEAKIENLSRG